MTEHYPGGDAPTEGPSVETLEATIPAEMAGARLDHALARIFPAYSRSRIQTWMRAGRASIDGRGATLRERVHGGERVTLEVIAEPIEQWLAEDIPLTIVYEDPHIIVVDKPAGLVVHPGAGNHSGTLLNALLQHDPGLAAVPRAGVVHRIDKDTTGLLVVARTLPSHRTLVEALERRAVHREYQAVVAGRLIAGGTVDAPIARHRTHRTKMAVADRGRAAVTHYRVAARYREHTLLSVQLETGRTHQIRVHMAHRGYPLIGDPVYGARLHVPARAGATLTDALRGFRRQALHAARLGLAHPESGETMSWESPLPADMRALLDALEGDAEGAR